MSSGLYIPLLLVGAAYAGLSIAAGMLDGRGETERGERLRDLAFGAALAAAVYTAILLILAAIDTPNRFTDAVITIVVICAFFALLLVVLFFVSQALSLLGRRRPGR